MLVQLLLMYIHEAVATTYVYPRARTALQLVTLKMKMAAGKEWSSMVLHPRTLRPRLPRLCLRLNNATKIYRR